MPPKERNQKKMQEFATQKEAASARTGTSMAAERVVGSPGGKQPEATPDLAVVLGALKDFRAEMSTRTDRLDIKLDLIQTRLGTMEERITETETRISALEDKMAPVETEMKLHALQLKQHLDRLDDSENRNRRSNVRIVGLPEGVEAPPAPAFFEQMIRDLFPEAPFTKFYSVERAHRTLGPRPAPGGRPRTVLVRFLHYRDRDVVLAAAREMGEVRYRGSRLSFFQDLTLTVQKDRKCFDTAKLMLRERGIPYAMLYPARLRLEWKNKTIFFTNPKEACTYIEKEMTAEAASDQNNQQDEIERND